MDTCHEKGFTRIEAIKHKQSKVKLYKEWLKNAKRELLTLELMHDEVFAYLNSIKHLVDTEKDRGYYWTIQMIENNPDISVEFIEKCKKSDEDAKSETK